MKNFYFKLKRIFIYSFFLASTQFINAQNFSWAKQLNSTGTSEVMSIKRDSDGDLILLLRLFSGTIDCDPSTNVFNLTSSGSNDIVFCKYTPEGDLIWAKKIGGTGDDVAYDLKLDNADNIYFCGRSEQMVDFDPGPNVYNYNWAEGFVIKLDNNGEFIWLKPYNVSISHLEIDSSDNLLISGIFSGTQNFNTTEAPVNLTAVGSLDVFVTKFDNSGMYLWTRQVGGVMLDNVFSMTTDNDDNIYFCGIFSFNADFDPSASDFFMTAVGSSDAYVCKLNSAGNFVWAKQFGGTEADFGINLAFDTEQNLYLTGRFGDTVDFDPNQGIFNLTSVSDSTAFIVKLGTDSNFIWALPFSANSIVSTSNIQDIMFDNENNLVLSINTQGTVDFDPGPGVYSLSTLGLSDMHLCKLTSTGQLIALSRIASENIEGIRAIDLDNNQNVYVSGRFTGTLDFDSGPGFFELTVPNGSNSQFIMKTKIDDVTLASNEFSSSNNSFVIYPNPNSGTFNIDFSDRTHLPIQIKIYNSIGEELFQDEFTIYNNLLKLDYPSGLYFVKVNNLQTKRVIIDKSER